MVMSMVQVRERLDALTEVAAINVSNVKAASVSIS